MCGLYISKLKTNILILMRISELIGVILIINEIIAGSKLYILVYDYKQREKSTNERMN